jgi:predicted AlkP superfamily pyrophosphatase or phosphodiesterase
MNRLLLAGTALTFTLASSIPGIAADKNADKNTVGSGKIKHVLLLSIDGMHAVDFYNCANGIAGLNGGTPYCPNMAALSQTGINYVNTESSKPSDSFPGMAALASGGTPKTTGLYYDVAFDRSLDPPEIKTGTGLAGGLCTPYAAPTGTGSRRHRPRRLLFPGSRLHRSALARSKNFGRRSLRSNPRHSQPERMEQQLRQHPML